MAVTTGLKKPPAKTSGASSGGTVLSAVKARATMKPKAAVQQSAFQKSLESQVADAQDYSKLPNLSGITQEQQTAAVGVGGADLNRQTALGTAIAQDASGAAMAPGTNTDVTATTLPAAPVFNPAGNKSWNGASGLSDDAVSWLSAGADSSYIDDVSSAQRTYDNFDADLTKQSSDNRVSRMAALRRLGYDQDTKSWNDTDLTTQRGQAMNEMGYDYGARGLLHSSEYAQRLTDAQNQFQDQANAMVTAGDQFNASVDSQRSNAGGELADAKLAAIRNAVQRRAASAGALS